MKTSLQLTSAAPRKARQGFTLVEMIVSVGIYSILLIGVLIAIQIFALRVYTLGATKLTATQGARHALDEIRDDIRQGKYVQVGNSDNSGNFTPYAGTNLASGNAILIYSTTNNNFQTPPWDLYYLQTNTVSGISSNTLIWITKTAASNVTTANLAVYITNLDVFATMDCWGNVTSNAIANNWLYTVKFQFYQWEYPIAVISTNSAANAYDYYQLRTRVARRALN